MRKNDKVNLKSMRQVRMDFGTYIAHELPVSLRRRNNGTKAPIADQASRRVALKHFAHRAPRSIHSSAVDKKRATAKLVSRPHKVASYQ